MLRRSSASSLIAAPFFSTAASKSDVDPVSSTTPSRAPTLPNDKNTSKESTATTMVTAAPRTALCPPGALSAFALSSGAFAKTPLLSPDAVAVMNANNTLSQSFALDTEIKLMLSRGTSAPLRTITGSTSTRSTSSTIRAKDRGGACHLTLSSPSRVANRLFSRSHFGESVRSDSSVHLALATRRRVRSPFHSRGNSPLPNRDKRRVS